VRFRSAVPRFGDYVSPADFAYGNWIAGRGSTLLTERDRGASVRGADGACGCRACAEADAEDWEPQSVTLTAESKRDALVLRRIIDALRETGARDADDDFGEDGWALESQSGAGRSPCGCGS
jgi:hypothetical protein